MNKRGIVLLNAVIVLLTIALIGASLTTFFLLVNDAAIQTVDEAKAFYLAEAGIAHAINILRNKIDASELEEKIGPIALGDGDYELEIDITQSLIISTGRVGSTKKTLQLQYAAL